MTGSATANWAPWVLFLASIGLLAGFGDGYLLTLAMVATLWAILAYGLKGPKKRIYKVRFSAAELWPDYKGPPHDMIEADLSEHWLEKLA